MNRRDFTKSLAAIAVLPAIPGVPARAATPAINPFTYAWSAHYASLSQTLSAEALANRFAMPPEVAQAIFARLQAAGIVAAPNAAGIANVTRKFAKPPVALRPKALQRAQSLQNGLDEEPAPEEAPSDPAQDLTCD